MHNKYACQPEKFRAWQTPSRVERTPQREKKPDGGTTTSTNAMTRLTPALTGTHAPHPLAPKLHLGAHDQSKLSFEDKDVPKCMSLPRFGGHGFGKGCSL